MKNQDKIIKKATKIVGIILAIVFVGMVAFSGYAVYNISPVNPESNEDVVFVVESGWGVTNVAEKLESEKLIRNALLFKIYTKVANTSDIYAGTYKLSQSMSVEDILNTITSTNSLENETISVTFVEGKRFPYYANKIAESFSFDINDIYTLTSSTAYLDKLISKYWFITDSVKNTELYYPLEGYIFPDTYSFKKNSTIEEVFDVMLTEMGNKLDVYKSEIETSGKSINDLLTMASMVELEAVTAEDRLILAGVFYNRINSGWTLGSDVTTYYAARKELTQSLTMSELNDCNAYNTRGTCVKGLPVGPIASPSYSSIIAAIEPSDTDYYYFVADKQNKLYFGITEADHQRNISSLKSQNLWPE